MIVKLAAILGGLLLLVSPVVAATVLRVVGDNNYPPYLFLGNDGKPRGYDVDVWKLWEQKTGIQVKLTATHWSDAQEMLLSGKADVIEMIFRTPERERQYDFTAPFTDVPVGVYADARIKGIDGPESLTGFEVGVERGDACVERLHGHGIYSLHLFTSYADIIDAAKKNQIRIFCMDEYPADYYLYRLGGDSHFVKAFDFYSGQFRRGVRKGDSQTLALIEHGMAMITPKEHEELRRKWMGQPINFSPYARIFGYALLGVTLAALLLLIWVHALRRAVERRTRDLDFLTHYDALTGMPNRRLLLQKLDEHMGLHASGAPALLLVDLDNFKRVNESFGYVVGDQIICTVADRLRGCMPNQHLVARVGGDEFVLAIMAQVTPLTVSAAASLIMRRMSEPFVLAGQEVFLGASIGVSFAPDDGNDGVTLLKNADAAMHRAKQHGRNNCKFYSSALSEHAGRLLRLGVSLRRALRCNEFELHYQPQMDLRTGAVMGVEALLRWPAAEDPISPHEFIPYAEETGLIQPIGIWVFEQACQQLKEWLSQGLPVMRMAVNLSPRQLSDRELVGQLRSVLVQSGIPSNLLELEITEGALMEHGAVATELLESMRQLGISLAIDDFGTGYSSLAYLRRFPVQLLKIDQSFLHDLPDDPGARAIVLAIVAMAHSLGMQVLAEGVENERQARFLREVGCDQAQGWLYGAAMPAEEFRVWLAAKTGESEVALGFRTS